METCVFCKEEGGREPKIGLLCGVCFSCATDKGAAVIAACMSGTFKIADFEAGKYKRGASKQEEGTVIQSLILSKETFPTEAEARAWVEENEFDAGKVDETENSFRFRQRPPEDFQEDGFGEGETFRTIELVEGVQATVGLLKEGKAWKAAHTVPLPASGTCPAAFPIRRGGTCFARGTARSRPKRRISPFVKVDLEKGIVTGPVLIPNRRDLQGDFEFREDIEEAAHGFLGGTRKIGEQHEFFDGKGFPVESWIAREPIKDAEGKELPAGTWLMSVKITDADTLEKVRTKKLNGFSIGFRGVREEVA